jgi:c-di-GMP-related signal transduction protein
MDVFVARQPILDTERRTVGYELLFRSGPENVFPRVDGTYASTRVLHDSLHVFGLDALAPKQSVYVNVTRDILLGGLFRLLPADRAVVEILETVAPDEEVLKACKRLKREGYRIALDDFVFRAEYAPLIALADVIKVDFIATKGDERARVVERIGPQGVKLLAEKIETFDEFQEAVRLGYTLFQGYFFARPTMLSARAIPGFKLNYLRLLGLVSEANFDFARVESVIKQDMALSIKLLRYLNSAAFRWTRKIESIRQAIVLLGEESFRKWASLVAIAAMADEVPGEVVVSSLVRARFCEALGTQASPDSSPLSCFLIGLLSMLDVIVGAPLPEVLSQLGVSLDVEVALLDQKGPLADLLATAIAYERGSWQTVETRLAAFGVTEEMAADVYTRALEWTHDVLGSELTEPSRA